MINLEGLIKAVQSSVDAAAEALVDKNSEMLKNYFHEVPVSELSQEQRDELPKGMKEETILRPKVVAVEYPKNSNGKEGNHMVFVPLLTLAPMSQLQISEMVVRLNFEIREEDGQAIVTFPTPQKSILSEGEKDSKKDTNAAIKIAVKNFGTPKGVDMVVEGYHKALRAQVPD